jgi:excisionase family DNA binding protein
LTVFPIHAKIFPKGGRDMGNTNEYIGTTEAAKLLRMTSRRVVGLCDEGKLPGAFRSGRNWRIPAGSVKQYMKDAGMNVPEEAADDEASTENVSGDGQPEG